MAGNAAAVGSRIRSRAVVRLGAAGRPGGSCRVLSCVDPGASLLFLNLRASALADKEGSMKTHPYLRAYLAGIFVPTLVLPLILTVFFVVRFVLKVPVPIERAIIFPMAVVPTLFGLWNMFYLASPERTHLPIGLYGTLIPLLGAPLMALGGSCLGM